MVVRYAYLWTREHDRGLEEGSKDRPAAILLALAKEDGEINVLAVPITHTPPHSPQDALEIPPETKRRLGLDDDRSWVAVSEANVFRWPGPDLRPVSPARDTCVYGFLPQNFYRMVRRAYLARFQQGAIRVIPRSE
jgi:hypothetical protein